MIGGGGGSTVGRGDSGGGGAGFGSLEAAEGVPDDFGSLPAGVDRGCGASAATGSTFTPVHSRKLAHSEQKMFVSTLIVPHLVQRINQVPSDDRQPLREPR